MPREAPTVKFIRSDLDRTRQIAPQILEHLRERILSLDLRPGTPLSRAELQQQFGSSQTPVRDALMKLEEEGLVTVYPQYATLVSKIDVDLARQAHFMRRAVEQEAVFTIASSANAKAVGDRLGLANEALEKLSETTEQSAFSDATGCSTGSFSKRPRSSISGRSSVGIAAIWTACGGWTFPPTASSASSTRMPKLSRLSAPASRRRPRWR